MSEKEADMVLNEAVRAAEEINARNETDSGFQSRAVSNNPLLQQNVVHQFKSASVHLYQRGGGAEAYGPNGWKRPCLDKVDVLVMGDSSIRAFGRKQRILPGYSITAYGKV